MLVGGEKRRVRRVYWPAPVVAARVASTAGPELQVLSRPTAKPKRDMDAGRASKAVNERLAAAVGGKVEGGAGSGPKVVFESISREDFRRWLDDHEDELRHWEYEPVTADSGRVIVYSFPSKVHESTAGGIMLDILKHVEDAGNSTELMKTFRMQYAPTINVGDRDQEPNGSLTPTAADIDAFPNLIAEIAYSQSWNNLVAKLERWMGPNTTVQVAIGVKVDRPNRRIILLQRDGQGVVRTEVDFAVGDPAPISFPLRALYHGVALPDALVGHEDDPIWIDLAWLRGEIDRFP